MKYTAKILWLLPILFLLMSCGANAVAIVPTQTATNTPMPTATPTIDPTVVAQACNNSNDPMGLFQSGTYSQVGDLILTEPILGGLTYPGIKLPDNIPAGRPYELPAAQGIGIHPQNPNLIPANPYLGYTPDAATASYIFAICNTSATQSYTLQSVIAQIATVIPDTSSNINIQAPCDNTFSSKLREVGGGCGGATRGAYNMFMVNWPDSINSGTIANNVTQESSNGSNDLGLPPSPYLPINLKPGQVYYAFINMKDPATPGTYTFQFGFQTGQGPAWSPSSAQVFFASHVHVWSGTSCMAYQSVIPNTSVEKFYVCPVNS